jgi:hypothetical protein
VNKTKDIHRKSKLAPSAFSAEKRIEVDLDQAKKICQKLDGDKGLPPLVLRLEEKKDFTVTIYY